MNYYLLAPEICLLVVAISVLFLDLFTDRKGMLAGISILGLITSIILAITLWDRYPGIDQATGLFNNTIFNGMLVADEFAIFFKVLFAGAGILVMLASRDYISKLTRFQGEYHTLILLSIIGMMLMAASRDLIPLYLSVELASLPLYALVGFLKDGKSTEASIKYLLLGGVASATLLFGMALMYGLTGSNDLAGISKAVVDMGLGGIVDSPALLMGIIFLISGFGFKIACVPFQMWVPDVYEGAPTPITAFLSVASKAAGFAIILRVFLEGFGAAEVVRTDWALVFGVLAAVTMTIGNVVAISQPNIKRMLGYSGIAQAGYVLVGMAAVTAIWSSIEDGGSSYGPTGVLFFLASYTITNLGAFAAIIAISNKVGTDLIDDYAGIGKRAPLLALGLTLCLISLTGIPPSVGFLAKFYLFTTAVSHDLIWLVVIAVLNTIISAYYYLRVVKVMWFNEAVSEEKVPSTWSLRLALFLACLGVLLLFFIPTLLIDPAQSVFDSSIGHLLPLP